LAVALLRLRDLQRMRIVGARLQAEEHVNTLAVAVGDDVTTASAPPPVRAPPVREFVPPPAPVARRVTARVLGRRHPTGVLGSRLSLSGHPFDVAIAPRDIVLVGCPHSATVECLQLEPLGVAGSVRTGAVPTRIAVNQAGTLAYVTNQFAEEIGIIDVVRRRQSGAVPIEGHPLGAALSPDDQTLFVTTNLDRLHRIRLAAGEVTGCVPIPMGCTSLLVHPSGDRLYVPTFRAGMILELDARTLTTTRRFLLGGVVHELACSSDGLTLYATNEDGWLDAIHLATGQRTTVRFESMANGLAVSPDDAVLYVSLLGAGHVVVVDRDTLAIANTIRTGGHPRHITFNDTGRIAVIANERGWVDVVY